MTRIPLARLVNDLARWAAIIKPLDIAAPAQPVRGRRGHPRSHYERVADVYREALAVQPRNPISYVQERFPQQGPAGQTLLFDAKTVSRWVTKARRLGLLGEAIPGQPGEKP